MSLRNEVIEMEQNVTLESTKWWIQEQMANVDESLSSGSTGMEKVQAFRPLGGGL